MSVSESLAAVERPPVPYRPWTNARIAGSILVAFWGIAILGLIYYLYSAWNIELIQRYGPKYMSGLWVTIQLVVISCILGALLSLPIAYGRDANNPIARAFCYGYVYFFRGTPLIAQTFLIYYGAGSLRGPLEAVGLWGFFREAWYCAIFAFSLNTAAYQAEILRGAIKSVPRGQWEGAAAVGL
jgi:polar amino acid transport system permease protein